MSYVHGYSDEEAARLRAQARTLSRWVIDDQVLETPSSILEIGAGVGGQTELLLQLYPEASVTAVEIEERSHDASVAWAKSDPQLAGRVVHHCGDAGRLPEVLGKHDAGYICWVLEHCADPVAVLKGAKQALRGGAPLLINEVYARSFSVEPKMPDSVRRYFDAFVQLQEREGGHPNVGARLGQFLHEAGFQEIETSATLLQLDDRDPKTRREMFDYMGPMLRSAEAGLLEAGLVKPGQGEEMENDLRACAQKPGAGFVYTIMRALARA